MSGEAAEPDVDLDYEDDVQETADMAIDLQSPPTAARSHSNPAQGPQRWAQCVSTPRDLGSRARRSHSLPLPPVRCIAVAGLHSCLGSRAHRRAARDESRRWSSRQPQDDERSRRILRQRRHQWPRDLPACHQLRGHNGTGGDAVGWHGKTTVVGTGRRRLGRYLHVSPPSAALEGHHT